MRIRKSEERIGKPLLVREGKGSRLTPFATKLMEQYIRLHTLVEQASDDIYENLVSDHLV
jgi:molybdate transport system regulatory protein